MEQPHALDGLIAEIKAEYDRMIRSLIKTDLWQSGPIAERRVLWTHAAQHKKSEIFRAKGLYIWGAKDRPIYLGRTGSFQSRFDRYVWHQRSQCNLAKEFESGLIQKGLDGFPNEIRQWYEKNYRGSTARLHGAVRFAKEGIDDVWFALLPMSDERVVRPLEGLLIPIANDWNRDNDLPPLENVQAA